jgi:hypothetical protein
LDVTAPVPREDLAQRLDLFQILQESIDLEESTAPIVCGQLRFGGPPAAEHSHRQGDAVDAGQIELLS